jgi:hypothetical protein
MISFKRRAAIDIAAAACFLVQAPGLSAQPLSPDAQQFLVYQPAYNTNFNPKSTGPRPTFLLQYSHRVSGKEYFGPSYAFSVNVERKFNPTDATERCDGAFNRPRIKDTKYRQRLSGYACAFVEESANAREQTQYRLHWYAKCNYVVSLAEETKLMALPSKAPIAPLLAALDRAVAALRLGECTDDVAPDATAAATDAQPPPAAPPSPPARSTTAPCSANLVARFLASLANQPLARRPAPGSIVALTEGGHACTAQMPPAADGTSAQSGPAKRPATEQRVIVVGRDGKVRIMTSAEAASAAANAPQFVVPSFAGDFQNLATTTLMIGPVQTYVDGQLVLPPLPNAPPGYKTGFDRALDWAEARVAAEFNWARENKAQAAITALSIAVAMALPEVPAVAALGSLGSTLVSGLTAPVLATSTTSFVNKFMSTGRTDKAALSAAQDAGILVLKALPSAFVGTSFKTVAGELGASDLVSSLAESGGSAAADLVVAYGPSILSQPTTRAHAPTTVSFTAHVAR